MAVGPAMVKACKSVLFTEGSPEVEIMAFPKHDGKSQKKHLPWPKIGKHGSS